MRPPYSLVVLTTVVTIHVSTGLRFTSEPEDKVAALDHPVWWNCEAVEDSYPVTYSWRHNGASLPIDNNYMIHANGSLWIRRVTQDTMGSYTCLATARGMRILSRTASLDLAYIKPTFNIQPRSQSVILGELVELSCYIESLPAADVIWRLNGKNITSGTAVQSQNGTSLLRLEPVMYYHAGTYKCVGTNPLNRVFVYSLDAELVVRGQPLFTTSLKSVTVPLGYNATFTCNFHGNPEPEVTWFVHFTDDDGGVTSQMIERTDPKYTVYENGTFIVWNVTAQDAAYYTCNVGNSFGEMSESAALVVSGAASRPQVTFISSNVTTLVNTDATFTCECDGNPEAQISWKKNGVSVSYNSTLTMKNVQPTDTGWYVCICENYEGTANRTVYLDVLYLSAVNVSSPKSQVKKGNPVVVHCQHAGNPRPEISWNAPRFGAVKASTSAVTVLENGTLYIITALEEDTGQYTCQASSGLGAVSASTYVTVLVSPRLTMLPVSQGVLKGGRVFLHCRAEGVPEPKYTWSKDGEGIVRSSDLRQIYMNNTLVIYSVQTQDGGVYRCLAENSLGVTQAVATVTVLVPPYFTQVPQNSSVKIGGSVQLMCLAEGDPIPTQKWLKDGRQLVIEDNMQMSLDRSVLTVTELRLSQFGKYTCVASNTAGMTNVTAYISVYDLPEFTVLPEDTQVNQSSTLTLKCQGHALEMPSVTWYIQKQGELILLENSTRVTISEGGGLVIKDVNEATDEGWYTCTLSNSAGKISERVYVEVQVPPSIMFTNSPQSAAIQSLVILSCQAQGDPTPLLQWISPEGHVITDSSSYLLTNHTLGIVSARETDFGNWTCQYCNKLGCATTSILLEQEGLPVIHSFVGFRDNDLVTLVCDISGKPTPFVTFSSQGQLVTTNLQGHIVEHSRIVIEVDYIQKDYSCLAKNSYGTVVQTVSLPSKMKPPSVESVKSRTVTLIWDLPSSLGNLPSIGYAVQWTSDISWQQKEVKDSGTSRTHQVAGLEPFTMYRFRIAARNVLGLGEFSETSALVETLSEAPSPPQNVVVLEIGDSIILLQWEPSAHLNADIDDVVYGYRVLKVLGSESDGITTDVLHLEGTRTHNQTLQVELTGLTEPVQYKISVWARNVRTNDTSETVDILVDMSVTAVSSEAEPQSEDHRLGTDKIIAIALGSLGGLIVVILLVFAITHIRHQKKTKSLSLLDHRLSLDQFYMENPKSDTDNDVLLVASSPLCPETQLKGSSSICNSRDNLTGEAERSSVQEEIELPAIQVSQERGIIPAREEDQVSFTSLESYGAEPPTSQYGVESSRSGRECKDQDANSPSVSQDAQSFISDVGSRKDLNRFPEQIYTEIPSSDSTVRILKSDSPKTQQSTKPRPPTRVISPGQLRTVPQGQNVKADPDKKNSTENFRNKYVSSDSQHVLNMTSDIERNGKVDSDIERNGKVDSNSSNPCEQLHSNSCSDSMNGSSGNLTSSGSANNEGLTKATGENLEQNGFDAVGNGCDHAAGTESLKPKPTFKNVIDDNFLSEEEIQKEATLAALY